MVQHFSKRFKINKLLNKQHIFCFWWSLNEDISMVNVLTGCISRRQLIGDIRQNVSSFLREISKCVKIFYLKACHHIKSAVWFYCAEHYALSVERHSRQICVCVSEWYVSCTKKTHYHKIKCILARNGGWNVIMMRVCVSIQIFGGNVF